MRSCLLCRQILMGLWWKERSNTVSAATMSCREIGIIIWAPTVAAVKRLICRLDESSQAETPGQRATLQNTNFTSIAKKIAGRKPGHSNSVIRVWKHFDVDDWEKREKIKWRNECFRSKNNKDHFLHLHALLLSEETKLVPNHPAYQFISQCDRQGC